MEAPKCYDAFQKMTQRDYPLSQQATDNTRPVGWNGRFSITITLVTAIGLLTLVFVGGVLGVGDWLAQKNTFPCSARTPINA